MKKNLFVFLLILPLLSPGLLAETYFVRSDGKDSNPGTTDSPEGAWLRVDHALLQLKAGDHLYVGDGTYITEELVLEDLQGAPDRITKIVARNTWKAALTQQSTPEQNTAVLTIANCSYLEIDGFEIYDPIDTGVGITVRNGSHHITIKNCYVHDCGCNGISSRLSDYLLIENNVVRGNATRNEWNCSGISIWHPVEHDQEPGYHIIIRKNVAFENECDLPFRPLGYDNPTDGNGIIVDDLRNTQGGGQEGGYHSDVLVENNLSFNNGGRGFNVYEADNVTLRNNTSYHNLRIISKYADFPGEITLSNSRGSRVYNNLIVKNPDLNIKALRCYDNDLENTKIYHNLIVGPRDFCGQDLYETANDFRSDKDQHYAGLVNPGKLVEFNSIEDFRKKFGLKLTSPAIDAGTDVEVPEEDLDGHYRPKGTGIDVGCYERCPVE